MCSAALAVPTSSPECSEARGVRETAAKGGVPWLCPRLVARGRLVGPLCD